MSDEDEEYRYKSKFGKVLYRLFLNREKKKITQKTLAEKSGVSVWDISRMVSAGSKFTKGETLYDDLYKIFQGLADLVGDISVDLAEELLKTIPDENLSRELRKKLLRSLTEEKIIKPMYTTLQGLPLIGRDDDIQKILDELQKGRFVVLSGTVGVGKSELAYQVTEVAKRTELFSSLKIIYLENKTSLEDALKDIHKELQGFTPHTPKLLVLDNCEHLKGLTGEVYNLLKEHAKLTILATSSIEMTGSDYPIEPLETNNAVQLFLKAAKKVAKNFTPTEENAPKIAELCIGLDGLPLALLLAAGLLKYDTFEQVHAWAKENRLLDEENFFSEDERHKTTLNALFERHYGLLKPNEQRLFRRLAIFVAPCSIKTVEAVCIIENDIPQQEQPLRNFLRSLANHYLISYIDGYARIAHNTISSFAWQKLREAKVNEDITEDMTEDMMIMEQFIDYYNTLICNYINTKYAEQEDQEAFGKNYKLLIRDVKNLHHAYEFMLEIRHQYLVRAIAKFIADHEDVEFRVVVRPEEEIDDLELIRRIAREEDGFILAKVQKLLGNPNTCEYLTKDEIDELNKWLEKGMVAPYATWVLWEFFMIWEVRLKNVVYWTD